MKIILLKDVKNIGKTGDVKDVAEGYAQNFLLPKKLAALATAGAIKAAEEKIARLQAEEAAEAGALRELAEKIKNKKISIKSKAKGGKLFGSVVAKDVVQEMQKENLEVSEKWIIMKTAIRKVGIYEIEIQLSDQIKTKIELEVIGE